MAMQTGLARVLTLPHQAGGHGRGAVAGLAPKALTGVRHTALAGLRMEQCGLATCAEESAADSPGTKRGEPCACQLSRILLLSNQVKKVYLS